MLSPLEALGQPSSAAEIGEALLRYFQSKGLKPGICWPSPHWLGAEQAGWPCYDLASSLLPDSVVVDSIIVSELPAPSAEHRVTAHLRPVGRGSAFALPWQRAFAPTFYAVRDSGRWVFSNTLERRTRAWERATVGPITFVTQPGIVFDRARAQRTTAWADSIAGAFSVPVLGPITYYVTRSPAESLRIIGVTPSSTESLPGGITREGPTRDGAQRMLVFSGDTAFGQDHRHELAHVLLAPVVRMGTSSGLASEGVATWLGGTRGMDFPAAAKQLGAYLAAHPAITLDSILVGAPGADLNQWNPAAAVLCHMVFESGGAAAVKSFLQGTPNEDPKRLLERLLTRSWEAIAADWRRRAMAF